MAEPFGSVGLCPKCRNIGFDIEYLGQRQEVTDGTGTHLRYQGGEDVLELTCQTCRYVTRTEPADKSTAQIITNDAGLFVIRAEDFEDDDHEFVDSVIGTKSPDEFVVVTLRG